MNWWLSSYWQVSPMLAVAWVFWVIFSVCLHELGHGVAAIRCGDDTPIVTGHMTWNPLVHMGNWSLIMFALFGFTWGLMPVNPYRFRGRHDEAFVAFAGPFVNLSLFIICAICSVLWTVYAKSVPDPFNLNLGIFLRVGVMINCVLFFFNLVPVPPLDGSRIVGDFIPDFRKIWQGEQGAVIGMVAMALLFMVGGPRISRFGFEVADSVLDACVRLLS